MGGTIQLRVLDESGQKRAEREAETPWLLLDGAIIEDPCNAGYRVRVWKVDRR